MTPLTRPSGGGELRPPLEAQLAQINLGTMVAAPDDPRVAEFMDALDEVNALAEASPGFVWRLQDDPATRRPSSCSPTPWPW